MAYIQCRDIAKSFTDRPLFDGIDCFLDEKSRIGLIGPNGGGKSTFMKLLLGLETADRGSVQRVKGVTIGYVPQAVTFSDPTLSISQFLEASLPETMKEEGTKLEIETILSKVGFTSFDLPLYSLSGGWQRRLLLARALLQHPDILFLDEPTNHLDLTSILFLEQFIRRLRLPFLIISHDRHFLDALCTSIWEINSRLPRGFFAVEGNYQLFLERKQELIEDLRKLEDGMRSRLRKEEAWLAANPKARTTKSRARIQSALSLKAEFQSLRNLHREKRLRFRFMEGEEGKKKILVAKNLSFSTEDGRCLFRNLDLSLYRGDRLAILGTNGSGKSTLLKILAEEQRATSGSLHIPTGIRTLLFEQHHATIDRSLTLRQTLAEDGDQVHYLGSSLHINGYIDRFLFTKRQLDLPISHLSGGEFARLMIARLLLHPCDLLLLDEPTNDLDIDTLEILEETLDDFSGACILVTHDRAMVERAADQLLALEEGGTPRPYNEIEKWIEEKLLSKTAPLPPPTKVREKSKENKGGSSKKKREIDLLEQKIAKIEGEMGEIHTIIEEGGANPDFAMSCERYSELEEELAELFSRWEKLSTIEES